MKVNVYEPSSPLEAGDTVPVTVDARLDSLKPDDVAVELYYGALNLNGNINNGKTVRMKHETGNGDKHVFKAELPCSLSGRHGFAVRIRPDHELAVDSFSPFFLKWEDEMST